MATNCGEISRTNYAGCVSPADEDRKLARGIGQYQATMAREVGKSSVKALWGLTDLRQRACGLRLSQLSTRALAGRLPTRGGSDSGHSFASDYRHAKRRARRNVYVRPTVVERLK